MRPATDAERKKLGIPPAYTDVMVSTDPKAELRATAKTAKGKIASYYSNAYLQRQEGAKWSRVMALQRAMPEILARIEKDSSNPRSKFHQQAMTLRLIAQTGLRNGGEGSGDKAAFGASNLRVPDHVAVDGDTVYLDFPGKHGIAQSHVIQDAALARYVERREASGATTLFDHAAAETLTYMKRVSGKHFKVHDLRTWHATVTADALVQTAVRAGLTPKTQKEFKVLRKQVAATVATKLGNTPAMALSTYIHPAVFHALEPASALRRAA